MEADGRNGFFPRYARDADLGGGSYTSHPSIMPQGFPDVAAHHPHSTPVQQNGSGTASTGWYSGMMESAADTTRGRLHQTLPLPRALSRADGLWGSSTGQAFSGNDCGGSEYALATTGGHAVPSEQASPRTMPSESLRLGRECSMQASRLVETGPEYGPHALPDTLSPVDAGFSYLRGTGTSAVGPSPYLPREGYFDAYNTSEGRAYYQPAAGVFDASSSALGGYREAMEGVSPCSTSIKADPDDDLGSVMHSEFDDGEDGKHHHGPARNAAPSTAAANTPSDTGSLALDEPYAKLIWKAFKSVPPSYSMTLQELYQWFRENTIKAKGEGKGWQNSIRHNLSMNAVRTLLLALVVRSPTSASGPRWGG